MLLFEYGTIATIISFNNRRKRQLVRNSGPSTRSSNRDAMGGSVELLDALDKGKNGKSALARGTVNIAIGVVSLCLAPPGVGHRWGEHRPDTPCIGIAQIGMEDREAERRQLRGSLTSGTAGRWNRAMRRLVARAAGMTVVMPLRCWSRHQRTSAIRCAGSRVAISRWPMTCPENPSSGVLPDRQLQARQQLS
ncbi:MAG: hypothetical protein IPO61_07305 [Gammaproteobacteria bacterium]|nr:hypothetical protein [Gammaproteobacteria bacterium]